MLQHCHQMYLENWLMQKALSYAEAIFTTYMTLAGRKGINFPQEFKKTAIYILFGQ
jgi:hypothetical protein